MRWKILALTLAALVVYGVACCFLSADTGALMDSSPTGQPAPSRIVTSQSPYESAAESGAQRVAAGSQAGPDRATLCLIDAISRVAIPDMVVVDENASRASTDASGSVILPRASGFTYQRLGYGSGRYDPRRASVPDPVSVAISPTTDATLRLMSPKSQVVVRLQLLKAAGERDIAVIGDAERLQQTLSPGDNLVRDMALGWWSLTTLGEDRLDSCVFYVDRGQDIVLDLGTGDRSVLGGRVVSTLNEPCQSVRVSVVGGHEYAITDDQGQFVIRRSPKYAKRAVALDVVDASNRWQAARRVGPFSWGDNDVKITVDRSFQRVCGLFVGEELVLDCEAVIRTHQTSPQNLRVRSAGAQTAMQSSAGWFEIPADAADRDWIEFKYRGRNHYWRMCDAAWTARQSGNLKYAFRYNVCSSSVVVVDSRDVPVADADVELVEFDGDESAALVAADKGDAYHPSVASLGAPSVRILGAGKTSQIGEMTVEHSTIASGYWRIRKQGSSAAATRLLQGSRCRVVLRASSEINGTIIGSGGQIATVCSGTVFLRATDSLETHHANVANGRFTCLVPAGKYGVYIAEAAAEGLDAKMMVVCGERSAGPGINEWVIQRGEGAAILRVTFQANATPGSLQLRPGDRLALRRALPAAKESALVMDRILTQAEIRDGLLLRVPHGDYLAMVSRRDAGQETLSVTCRPSIAVYADESSWSLSVDDRLWTVVVTRGGKTVDNHWFRLPSGEVVASNRAGLIAIPGGWIGDLWIEPISVASDGSMSRLGRIGPIPEGDCVVVNW